MKHLVYLYVHFKKHPGGINMLYRVAIISLFTLHIFLQSSICRETTSNVTNETSTSIVLKNGNRYTGLIISENNTFLVLNVKGNTIRILKTLITTRNGVGEKSTKSVSKGIQTHIVLNNGTSYIGRVVSEDNSQVKMNVNGNSIHIRKSLITKRKTERNLPVDTAKSVKVVQTVQSPKVRMASPPIPENPKPVLAPGNYSLVKQQGILPAHSSPPPESDGKKQLIIGGFLMAVSVTNIGYIAIKFPLDWNAGRRNQNYSAPALIGLGSLISGIIMLVKGGRYRAEHREWKQSKSQ